MKTIQEKEVSILMTYSNKIKKIEIEFNEVEQGFSLVFDGKTLETQRNTIRFFKGLPQIASFFQEMHEKNFIEAEMQEKDLAFHLENGGIKGFDVHKNKDGFVIIFLIQGNKVNLVTQKSKKRIFKSLQALMSFIKVFFGDQVYKLEAINFLSNEFKEEFISAKNEKSAYEKFVLKLADPQLKFS